MQATLALPARRIGVLGAGQLGRMLELAGRPLGQRVELLATPEAPGEAPDVLTFESESLAPEALALAARGAPIHPPLRALVLGQDRVHEKELFARLGIETAAWAPLAGGQDLPAAVVRIGLPALLKTRRGGYDGRGQWPIRSTEDVARAARELGARPAVLERFVPFTRELSILAVRAADGERACYPLVENHHVDGILRLSLAPARVAPRLQCEAEAMAQALLTELEYVGVLALELFEHRGRLLANELAPRVHNSGHWTIEGAETSQFENHLRAIAGLPLGSTRALGPCAMVNLIGSLPPARAVLAVPGAHLHDYGKEPRPGRKLGHVTLRAASEPELAARLAELAGRIDLALPEAVRRWMHSSSCAST